MALPEQRRSQLEKEIERQYNLLAEYEQKIGLEGDPRQREQLMLYRNEVKRYIEELERELKIQPLELTTTYFRRNYINLVDMSTELVGRDQDQKKLVEMLSMGGCVAILGVGGQGKTSLAYSYLKPYLDGPGKFEAAIWQTMEGNGTDLTDLAERLDLKASSNPNETAESIREYLMSHPIIIILDNFETTIREDGTLPIDVEALLKRIAELRSKSQLIITTRELPKGYRLKVLALDGLSPQAGADLLAEQGLGEEPRSQLLLAAEKARGNPFALKLLADLATDPFTADNLESMLQQGDLWDKELAERLLGKMWNTRLNEEEKRLLQILSVLRPPARRATLRSLLIPTTDVQLRDLLSKLSGKSLLSAEFDPEDTRKAIGYDLHPLFRRFIQSEGLAKNTMLDLHFAAAEYFKSLIPSLPSKENYARKSIKQIWPILEAIHHLNELEDYNAAFKLFFRENLHIDLTRWGEYITALEIYLKWEVVLAKFENENIKASLLLNLGGCYRSIGQAEKAVDYCERALELGRKVGDKRSEAVYLGNLGIAYMVSGQPTKAAYYLEEALIIGREIGDKWIEANSLGNLGAIYRGLGQTEKALEYLTNDLEIDRKMGYKLEAGLALGTLAGIYRDLGEFEQAIEHYEQALSVADEIGDRSRQGLHLHGLGQTYYLKGDKVQALICWRRSIEIYSELKLPDAEELQKSLDRWRTDLGEAAFTQLWAESEVDYQKLKNQS